MDKELLQQFTLPIILIALWSLPWKGVALWKAVKNNHTSWFIVLLLINTIGILEIIYIFIFSKKSIKKDIIDTTLNF